MSSRTENLYAEPPMRGKPPAFGEHIGTFRNEWRQRTVYIYNHPTDAGCVVTCGVPFAPIGAEWIWTTEPRATFAQYIGSFNKVYR